MTWFDVYWKMTQSERKPQFRSNLMVGSYFRHETVVKLLLATGKAEIDSKDNWGRTLLSLAAQDGHEVVVRLL
jgi:hypothetical protein